jgi:hypothetical protein
MVDSSTRRGGGGIAFVVIGVVFMAMGITRDGGSAFIGIGAAFMVIGLVRMGRAHRRR